MGHAADRGGNEHTRSAGQLHRHGAALAAVALALAPQVGKVYIGSDFAYDMLPPLGAHPLLDPLWGTEQLQLVHDGCEISRWQKIEKIIDDETVQRHLRVCWLHSYDAYNCGHCAKCLRILAWLAMMGMSGRVKTALGAGNLVTTENLIRYGESCHADAAVLDALRASLRHTPADMKEWFVLDMRQRTRMIKRLETRLQTMASSRSWRWTAPVRALARAAMRRQEIDQ